MSWQAAIGTAVPVPMRPMPRLVLTEEAWRTLGPALAAAGLEPAALWADTQQVHLLVADGSAVRVLSVPVAEGRYPALSPDLPGCARAERVIADLYGHQAEDGLDSRPLLDHGAWTQRRPLSGRPVAAMAAAEPPEFIGPAEAEQLGRGPQVGDLLPPAHWRGFIEDGRLVAVDTRAGYLHRGIPALLRGKSPRAAARFVARLDGRATVAHATAFARAAEAASEAEPPDSARRCRVLLLALERVAAGLDARLRDLPDAGDGAASGPGGARTLLFRALRAAFGHPLAMDAVVPGGMSLLPSEDSRAAIRQAIAACRRPPDTLTIDDLDEAEAAIGSPFESPGLVGLPPASGEGLGQARGPRGEVWHWLRLDGGQIATAVPLAPMSRPPVAGRMVATATVPQEWRLAVPGADL